MQRRTFLGAAGTGALGALAGCVGGGGGGSGGGGATDSATPTASPTGMDDTGGGNDGGGGTASFEDHPAVRDFDVQPTIGEPSGTAIVAFEDPSCTICKRFEQNTFPKIESELVATGKATFTYRVFPVVYEWGKPAVQALEATYAADSEAFWGLKDYYYANQDGFGGGFSSDGGDPLDGARQYLSGNTDLDADAIVQAAKEKKHDAAVQADLKAGKDAGASSTPTFFVFVDGEYRTKITGAQSLDVFRAAISG